MHQSPEDMVELNTYANEFMANVMRAKLEDSGIFAQAAASGPLLGVFGANGWIPFTLWVRRSDAGRAKAVLEEARAEQGTVDWDAVDVGNPDPTDLTAQQIVAGVPYGLSKHARLGIAGVMLIASVLVPIWELRLGLLLGASMLALPVLLSKKQRQVE